MKEHSPKPARGSADDRNARLAEALRTNLHRRKAQARAAAPSKDGDDKPDQ